MATTTTTTTTGKGFTKGQRVLLLKSWDDKGTVRALVLNVHSCGSKRMVLNNDDGSCYGRDFYPWTLQAPAYAFERDCYDLRQVARVLPLDSVVDIDATARAFAEEYIASERERMQSLLERNADAAPGYLDSLRRSIDALHAPEVLR